MKKFFLRLIKLIFGLFMYAVGIITCINSNIGYAPWDVFHVGLSQTTGLSIGEVSILAGIVIVIFNTIMKETFGIGTILNVLLIGGFLDLINWVNIIPVMHNFWYGLLMMQIGLLVMSIASYFYISSGFGAGPRDSLMVLFTRKSGWPVGVCRSIVESVAVISGFFLGGYVGLGTLIFVLLIGIYIQIVFKAFKFEPKNIKQESLKDTFNMFKKVK